MEGKILFEIPQWTSKQGSSLGWHSPWFRCVCTCHPALAYEASLPPTASVKELLSNISQAGYGPCARLSLIFGSEKLLPFTLVGSLDATGYELLFYLIRRKAYDFVFRQPLTGDHLRLKGVLVGGSCSGKTSLLHSLRFRNFSTENHCSIRFDHVTATNDEAKFKLQLWDTVGQESFRAVTLQCVRGQELKMSVARFFGPPKCQAQTSSWPFSVRHRVRLWWKLRRCCAKHGRVARCDAWWVPMEMLRIWRCLRKR